MVGVRVLGKFLTPQNLRECEIHYQYRLKSDNIWFLMLFCLSWWIALVSVLRHCMFFSLCIQYFLQVFGRHLGVQVVWFQCVRVVSVPGLQSPLTRRQHTWNFAHLGFAFKAWDKVSGASALLRTSGPFSWQPSLHSETVETNFLPRQFPITETLTRIVDSTVHFPPFQSYLSS